MRFLTQWVIGPPKSGKTPPLAGTFPVESSTPQGAQTVAGLLALPVIIPVVSQTAVAPVLDGGVVVVVGLPAVVGDLMVFHMAVRRFDRDRVVTRL